MKNYMITTLILVSGLSMADALTFSNSIKVERSAQSVNIDSVSTEIVGEHGFPSTRVLAKATFGNKCVVPKPEELVKIVQHANSFSTLSISVGNQSNRACPMVYMPVTVTLDLGIYTKPNDGLFSKVIVNGKIAQKN